MIHLLSHITTLFTWVSGMGGGGWGGNRHDRNRIQKYPCLRHKTPPQPNRPQDASVTDCDRGRGDDHLHDVQSACYRAGRNACPPACQGACYSSSFRTKRVSLVHEYIIPCSLEKRINKSNVEHNTYSHARAWHPGGRVQVDEDVEYIVLLELIPD